MEYVSGWLADLMGMLLAGAYCFELYTNGNSMRRAFHE